MDRSPDPEATSRARKALAERAARVARIRRRVVASGIVTFVLAFALVAESGSFGAVSSSSAAPSSQSAAASSTASTAATDNTYSDDTAAPTNDVQDAVSPVTTSQS